MVHDKLAIIQARVLCLMYTHNARPRASAYISGKALSACVITNSYFSVKPYIKDIFQGRRKQFWSGPAKLYMKLQLKYSVKHNQQAKHAIARGSGGIPLKISYPE